jgi:transcriptional regulator with PAS, ATPase and Fis domain
VNAQQRLADREPSVHGENGTQSNQAQIEVMPRIVNIDFDSKNEVVNESESAKKTLKRDAALKQIIGKSEAVKSLRSKIELSSSCDVSVLITGESGTGKELAARAIHYLSDRSDKPFIPVNCGAIPETLFENELFGHVKGAFTDAGFQQKGSVKEAEGGTLFLDEIGTISPFIQIKLLRLLENKEYKPLGDSHIRKANIRMIAATNRDLFSLIREGIFREDLFYRLNIVLLHIRPLRERKEDIPILIDHFNHKYCNEYHRELKTFSKALNEFLYSYHWPGNIRELENKVQQLIVMSTTNVISSVNTTEFCPFQSGLQQTVSCLKNAKKEAVNMFEKNYLMNLLSEHRGNVAAAAKSSGKSRTALWNLISKHHISPKQFRTDI